MGTVGGVLKIGSLFKNPGIYWEQEQGIRAEILVIGKSFHFETLGTSHPLPQNAEKA